MTKKGKVIVLVAPSGAGKTSIAKKLISELDNIKFSVSATTRPPRDYEADGLDYHFLSEEEFLKAVEEGSFLEWEEFYGGKKYGTLRSAVDKQLESGYFTLLDIEVNGALNVKKIFGDQCLSLFIKPPSLEVLKQRLQNRDTESKESLSLRIERAKKELTYADRFDRIIINDDFETAYQQVKQAVIEFMNS